MPKRPACDKEKLTELRKKQLNVITRAQARACGLASSTIGYLIREGGPWQVLLPGIYLTTTGAVTQEHREMAALLHAGAGSMITGPGAARRHGLTALESGEAVDVLVYLDNRRQSISFARLHRTKRMPREHERHGPVRFAKAPRAVADTARELTSLDEVRSLVYEAVQKRKCKISELLRELSDGPTRRCSMLRTVLAELVTGVRSIAEKDLQVLIRRGRIPAPMYNAKLFTIDGQFIAMVDTWWEEAATAGEVDSRAYHSSVAAQDRDRDRHTKLITHGIYPMHFSTYRIRQDGEGIIADIKAALEMNRRQVPLPIVAVGPDQEWTPEAAARMRERIASALATAQATARVTAADVTEHGPAAA
jgi:very-short-patch-repair endonuclease